MLEMVNVNETESLCNLMYLFQFKEMLPDWNMDMEQAMKHYYLMSPPFRQYH